MTDNYTPPAPHDLLIQVRDVILNNPERHNQGSWITNEFSYHVPRVELGILRRFAAKLLPEVPEDEDDPICGTQACVAGWAVILGDDPTARIFDTTAVTETDGTKVEFGYRARDLLGLDSIQAHWLFAADRTRDEVLDALNALIDNPATNLTELYYEDYTVTVTDSHGNQLYTTTVSVDTRTDDDDPDDNPVEDVLYRAYQRF